MIKKCVNEKSKKFLGKNDNPNIAQRDKLQLANSLWATAKRNLFFFSPFLSFFLYFKGDSKPYKGQE